MKELTEKTYEMIDNLKGICSTYGLGNTGNEYKIITEVFLYKFFNDRSQEVAKFSFQDHKRS